MKTFHLVSKQTHIAATTFDFKDYEDNSILFMRIYKESKWHDQWAALQEGDKFTLSPVGIPVIQGQWELVPESDIETEVTETKPNENAGL